MTKTQAHILIVEDNPTNIDVLFDYLDEAGFDISVATNGENALLQCELTQPDIILLDVMMAGIDGFETCRRLKANPKTAEIPVIFMTALADVEDKLRGFAIGAVDYVTKPIQHAELRARITTHTKIRQLQKQAEMQNDKLQRMMGMVERSKQLLTTVIDATPDWIFAIDTEDRFILANQAIAKAFRLTPQAMVGRTPVELGVMPQQIWGDVDLGVQGLQTNNSLVFQGELWHNPQQYLIYPDGTRHILDTYKLPLRDKDEVVFAVLTTSRDITAQKEAELVHQKQDELQRAMLDNAAYAIISTDTQGIIQTFNPAAERMLGYRAEEVIGKTTPALIHDVQEVMKRAQEFSQGLGVVIEPGFEVFVAKSRLNLPNEHEWTYIHKNGTRFPIWLTITALRDNEGVIFGFLGIANDITERKKLQASLEAQQHLLEDLVADRTRRLELIAEMSKQLTAILDLHKLLDVLVNQLKESFGYYHVQVYLTNTDGSLTMFAGSGQVGHQLKAKNHQLRSNQGIVGKVAVSNEPFMTNDVNLVPEFFRNPLLMETQAELAVPLHVGGQVVGVLDIQSNRPNIFTPADISMMQSIADQAAIAVQNAQLLTDRQATIAKLEVVDRAKSQFITMMSHELRTPLHAINGFSELLLMGLSGDLPPQVHEDVQLIYNNGQHLLALINDVLDVSQIESGQVQLVLQPVNVKELVQRVLETTQMLIGEKSLEMIINAPDDLPILYADSTRVHQILLNLVGNAIKFTGDGGRVTIEAHYQPEEILFKVIDTGIGIPKDKLQAIFEAFQQADMSDARRYGGTGLGLTISQKLVQLHGGKMGVNSQEGVGSEFFFTIPLSAELM